MSITAEKVEQVARIIDPHKWSLHDAAVGDLYAGYRKSLTSCSIGQATAILSLLQQGEPEGWRHSAASILAKRQYDRWREENGKLGWPEFGEANTQLIAAYYDEALEDVEAMLSASPLPPAPGAETGGKKLKIDRDWCIEAAKREEAAGDPDCSVGTFLVPPSPEQEEYLDKVKTLGIEYDRSAIVSSSRQAVLEEAVPVSQGDVRCTPELGGCWIDDQGKCQHCGLQHERKK